jgi:hypothetical protein
MSRLVQTQLQTIHYDEARLPYLKWGVRLQRNHMSLVNAI